MHTMPIELEKLRMQPLNHIRDKIFLYDECKIHGRGTVRNEGDVTSSMVENIFDARPVEALKPSRRADDGVTGFDLDLAEPPQIFNDFVDGSECRASALPKLPMSRSRRSPSDGDQHLEHRAHKAICTKHSRRIDPKNRDILFTGDRLDLFGASPDSANTIVPISSG